MHTRTTLLWAVHQTLSPREGLAGETMLYISYIGSSDMFNVEDEVLDVAPKWEKFGGALGLDSRVLNRIKAESSSTEDGLHKTLQEFLKMNYETQVHGQPSWQLIVKALAHRNGGNDKELALEVAKEHSTAPPGEAMVGVRGM